MTLLDAWRRFLGLQLANHLSSCLKHVALETLSMPPWSTMLHGRGAAGRATDWLEVQLELATDRKAEQGTKLNCDFLCYLTSIYASLYTCICMCVREHVCVCVCICTARREGPYNGKRDISLHLCMHDCRLVVDDGRATPTHTHTHRVTHTHTHMYAKKGNIVEMCKYWLKWRQ